MIDALEAEALDSSTGQGDEVTGLFNRLRAEMQGLAGVVVHIEAEHNRAKHEGEAIAASVIGLLRFFSPTACSASSFCPIAPLGSEIVPISKIMAFGDRTFAYSESVVSHPLTSWQISRKRWEELCQMGLIQAMSLLNPDGLTDFGLAVRSALLAYGVGTTVPDPNNRLVHTLSSVESLLLRHAAEPTEFTVGERMSFALAQNKVERDEVAQNVRQAYRLRRRHGTKHMAAIDEASLTAFLHNAHRILHIALNNLNSFRTRTDFLEAIDQRR